VERLRPRGMRLARRETTRWVVSTKRDLLLPRLVSGEVDVEGVAVNGLENGQADGDG